MTRIVVNREREIFFADALTGAERVPAPIRCLPPGEGFLGGAGAAGGSWPRPTAQRGSRQPPSGRRLAERKARKEEQGRSDALSPVIRRTVYGAPGSFDRQGPGAGTTGPPASAAPIRTPPHTKRRTGWSSFWAPVVLFWIGRSPFSLFQKSQFPFVFLMLLRPLRCNELNPAGNTESNCYFQKRGK